ncbi:O-methyltransferase [Actinophytocola sp.]|jgi:O-methyltransferase|uniref:O-methyltransferase n=1 Tax=Actinophytocola sp. TaxID=1872138 RepID=UPI002EDA894C
MSQQTDFSPALLAYVRDMSLRDDEILRDLRHATSELPMGQAMQVMAEEGQFLALLVSLTDARLVVEVGTFTGYSTLCMARALPPGGRLVTCDITDRWSPIALPHWRRAGVADRIETRTGDARRTLADLLAEYGPDSADLVFVDADKAGYQVYYEHALELVRPGGLVVLDNTVFFGRVLDGRATDQDTGAIQRLNAHLRDDDRIDLAMLPMADGITLARKRKPGR